MWYDKQGNKLDDYSEIEKLLSSKNYKVIKQEYTSNHKYWVSTVWLGLDHNFSGNDKPLIFETMVFNSDDYGVTNYCEEVVNRYSTEEEALKGHKLMFKKWNKK